MFRQGIVKWYDDNEHYGFIIEDGVEHEEIFFHKSSILTEDKAVDNNQRVSFDIKKTDRGLEAIDVSPLD
jgi:cold shock protein